LVKPLPDAIGLRLPKPFAEFVQTEEFNDTKLNVGLGMVQSEALRKVLAASFGSLVMLPTEASAADKAQLAAGGAKLYVEPSVDSYIYLRPRDGAADYYSATIGYKVDLRSQDGSLVGSWIYEGYGSVPAGRLSARKGVEQATALAIRDAFANVAVHLPQQELLLGLLPSRGTNP
jgi:hypothetical protein